uniref:Uncharacterized protein n=1 Tax=Arundo donax TaxID=35708 RepID=A0A0A9BPC0_ARUDO
MIIINKQLFHNYRTAHLELVVTLEWAVKPCRFSTRI